MNQNDNSKRWWESPKVVIVILTVVAGAGLVSVFLPLGLSWGNVLSSKKAQFYVTEVGVPLLTFSGFLAVYLGFLSQREQNELQERQLQNQREQIEAQQANFQKDRFESTFFQLLRTHNQIVDDIRIEQKRSATQKKGKMHQSLEELEEKLTNSFFTYGRGEEDVEIIQIHGRSCFEYFYIEFGERFKSEAEKKEWGDGDKADESNVKRVYWKWFGNREAQLNHYFSNLSKLISFVDRSEVGDKAFYMELISTQMSAPELKLFFYHVTLMKGKSGHRYLSSTEEILEEYSFFERLHKRSLIHVQHHRLSKAALNG